MAADACRYLDAVLDTAMEAGRRILDVYERDFTVAEKEDGSPVTAADQAAQDVIVERLERLAPDIPILAEESAGVDYDRRAGWKRFWLVDPLDGTKEFVSRNGEFTVNIALVEEGRPVLGVVYVPVTGVAYLACKGGGALKQKGLSAPERIRARGYQGGKPMIVASRSHVTEALKQYIERIGAHDLVSMGSSLKFCLVADGTADVYPRLGPTMEWDTAAAQCVVEEAGGRVVGPDNRPMTYNKPSLRNPWLITSGKGDYDWARFLPEQRD
jgi:3'(2'), 5'-bisphosphate nucleotidase